MASNKRKKETETDLVGGTCNQELEDISGFGDGGLIQSQPSCEADEGKALSSQTQVYKKIKSLLNVLKQGMSELQTQIGVWETLTRPTTWSSRISKLHEKASLLTEEQRTKIQDGLATFKEISEWFDIPCMKKLMYYFPIVKRNQTEQVSTSEKLETWELTENWDNQSSGFKKFFEDRKHTDKDLNEFIQEFADVIVVTWAVQGIIIFQEDSPKEDSPKEDESLKFVTLTADGENKVEQTEFSNKESEILNSHPKSITDIFSQLTLDEWKWVYCYFQEVETGLRSGLSNQNSTLADVPSINLRKDFLSWLGGVKVS
jgi:hypothetical protein